VGRGTGGNWGFDGGEESLIVLTVLRATVLTLDEEDVCVGVSLVLRCCCLVIQESHRFWRSDVIASMYYALHCACVLVKLHLGIIKQNKQISKQCNRSWSFLVLV
jgi:hypothetical protein